jgi:hypothetical protein
MKTPLKLSNLWENYEQLQDGIGYDTTLVWLFNGWMAIKLDKAPPIYDRQWWAFCRDVLLNFKNDPRFRAIFTGYTEAEKEAIKGLLEQASSVQEKDPSRLVCDRMAKDLMGQNFHGLVFGTGRIDLLDGPAALGDGKPKILSMTTDAHRDEYKALKAALLHMQDKVRLTKDKYRSPSTVKKPLRLEPWQRENIRRAERDVEKAYNAIERFKHNQKGMRDACKAAGLSAATFNQSGMVKGWGNFSKGYQISPTYPLEIINLYQVSKDEYCKVLDELTVKGFKVISSDMPSKAINGDSVATIAVEQYHADDDLLSLEQLNEATSTITSKFEAHDQFGICSVCGGELVNKAQAKAGRCDECK